MGQTMLMRRRRRQVGWPRGKVAHGRSRALEARDDEEDGEEADAQRSPRDRGRPQDVAVGEDVAAFRGPTAVDKCGWGRRHWRRRGRVRRRRNLEGQWRWRISGGRGWGTSRNTAVGEDDGGRGGGHDVGDGSEWLSVGGGASLLYIYTPL
jgi:hypothetical protein